MVKAAGGHSKNKDKYQGWLRSSLFWHGPLICAAVSSPGFILFRNKKKKCQIRLSRVLPDGVWVQFWKPETVGKDLEKTECGKPLQHQRMGVEDSGTAK